MFYGFTASNTTQRDSFKFYFLQSSNNSQYYFVYMCLYSCLKYYKTVHNLSVFMNYVPNEVLYVLTRALLKYYKQRPSYLPLITEVYDTVSRV